MPTVSAALKMFDMMTQPLQHVTQALNLTIAAMDDMNNSANRDMRITNTLNTARDSIARAGAGLQELANAQENAKNHQNRLNDSFNNGSSSANGLIGKVKGLIGTYLSLQAIKKGAELTDDYVNQNSRLALINDGLQTQEQLNNKIYLSAQRSRGAYDATASTVAKLGLLAKDSFSSNDETIAFAELMNKSFKISGASISEATNGMYQLTQAMASGRLQGDEFRSIMENAPMLAQAIADYTGKSIGELRKMSAEGTITSNVIKNSLFNAANDINSKFETMPQTFGSVMANLGNKARMAFIPVMQRINNFLNSSGGKAFVDGLSKGMFFIANLAMKIGDIFQWIGSTVSNNWGVIEPIIWGIVTALGIYNLILLAHKGYMIIVNGLKLISAAREYSHAKAILANASAHGTQAIATAEATIAQAGFNTALLACPLTWIIIAIIAIIVAIYAVIGAINKITGKTISATGVICGAISAAGAFVWDLFLGVLELVLGIINRMVNPFIRFANFLGNVFTNPISSIIYSFQSMADSVLGVLQKIASAMDFIFGSNMSGTIQEWRNGLKDMADNAVKKYAPNENYEKIMDELDLSVDDLGLKRITYSGAYDKGYKFGADLSDKFSIDNLFGDLDSKLPKDLNNNDWSKFNNPSKFTGMDDANKKLKSIDDKIDISNEHLEMLRDLAEEKSISNFTTLTPTISFGNVEVKEEADINKIISKIETYMENELANSAEGVYA